MRPHDIRHALINNDFVSLTEDGRRIVSQDENVEFAQPKSWPSTVATSFSSQSDYLERYEASKSSIESAVKLPNTN